jgi:hypothetical protein
VPRSERMPAEIDSQVNIGWLGRVLCGFALRLLMA